MIDYARNRRVEILEMPDVVQFMLEHTPTNRAAGSESEHVLRLIKLYGFEETRPEGAA